MSIVAKQRLLIAISLAAILAVLLAPRIAQDLAYHEFADQKPLGSIPNALNVLSNLMFLWIGAEGLLRLLRQQSLQLVRGMFPAYVTFFAALILIAAASAYYHWAPGNETLAWDRMAMTLAFMSFFAIVIGERVSLRAAQRLFPLLLLVGVASVVYWHFSEQGGAGDLRPYALVQFLPMLLVPFILLSFPSPSTRGSDLWWLLVWYLVAKLCELYDEEIYHWLILLSGHSLKHICASIGCLMFLRHLRLRRFDAA